MATSNRKHYKHLSVYSVVGLGIYLSSLSSSTAEAQQFPEDLQKILSSPRIIYYDMPEAFQFASGNQPRSTVFYAGHNFSASKPREPTGNSFEFPWRHPGGTDLIPTNNVSSRKFLLLPDTISDSRVTNTSSSGTDTINTRSNSGISSMDPVVYFTKRMPRRFSPGFSDVTAWVFPVDTVVGEILSFDNGTIYEIRTRTREIDDWAVDIFRPFTTYQELDEAGLDYSLVKQHVTDADSHDTLAFDVRTETFAISTPLTERQSRELLTNATFRSVLGSNFSYTQNVSDYHIIPRNTFFAVLGTSRESCSRCHKDTLADVNNFNNGRDWYGRVRGSDGIFSFHPFAPQNISRNGGSVPVALNQELISRRIIAPYNPAIHPQTKYKQLVNYSEAVRGGDTNTNDETTVMSSGRANTISSNSGLRTTNRSNSSRTVLMKPSKIDYDLLSDLIINKIRNDPAFRGPAGSAGPSGPAGPTGMTGATGPIGPPGQVNINEIIAELPPIRMERYSPSGILLQSIEKPLGDPIRMKAKELKRAEN